MTEPARLIAPRPGVPTATRNAPPLAGEQLVEITDTILDSLDVGFDLPPDINADGAEGWLTRDPQDGVTGGSVRRFFRRGENLAEVEERETAAVSTRRDLRYPTPLGEGFLESDLHHVTLRVPIRQGVTVIVQASNMELLHDLARRMRHQQGISHGLGPQREQVSA